MTIAGLGYPKGLFVLPFDHRSSFERGLLGISGRQPDSGEVEQLSAYKRIIYEGLLEALSNGVPKESAAMLVDQKYGARLLAEANALGIVTCAPVEKSGQSEFDFEYGDDFRQHIEKAAPTFTKALVRYNPEGDATANEKQRRRLATLSDYAHSNGYKFMFELLVPATESQAEAVAQDIHAYDLKLRPELTTRPMAELQDVGVEPDVWKLEGTEDPEAARSFVAQARAQLELWLGAEAVAPLDAVAERVDRGAGDLVHRTPGVPERHRGLEDEQVVVPCVVEVDRSATSHCLAPSGLCHRRGTV
ncbi:MAG: DUF2090 domain-containing protein [Gemmatimonadetes bacterium]|nr:DUF2090 domain-containing protein [Gemmatimonadota bacterium]